MPQIAGFRGALNELPRDATRALYRYHQTFELAGRSVTRKLTLAAVRLSPWAEGTIRPHAATDPQAREAAGSAIAASRSHAVPFFAGYRDAAGEVDRGMRGAETGKPTLELTTADRTTHRVWRLASAELIGKLRPLFAPKKLHVLAGHAVYEAMVAHAESLGVLAQYSAGHYGLGCLVNLDDPTLIPAARHRIVRGAGTRDALLAAARPYFLIEPLAGAARDAARCTAALAETVAHQPAAVVVLAGEPDAYKLTLQLDVTPVAAGIAVHRAVQKYDPIVVEHLLIARAMPGAATTFELDPSAVLRAVERGADAGVIVRPISLGEVLHADELGAILPVGSTAFPPALANVVSFAVEPDEDLV